MSHRSIHLIARATHVVVAAALASVFAACGNVTVGGFTRVTVDVSGDAADPQPQPAPLAAVASVAEGPAVLPVASAVDGEEPEGEVEIDIRLTLVSDVGDLVALGHDDIRIKLDLQGVDEAEAVSQLVPAARYTELRIGFTHIQVEVEGGLVIDGQPVTGEVHVALEDPELVVVRPVDIEAVEGSRVELLLDLNSPDWLAAVDLTTRTIDASVFADMIDLVAR
jgi:hypothetical protein